MVLIIQAKIQQNQSDGRGVNFVRIITQNNEVKSITESHPRFPTYTLLAGRLDIIRASRHQDSNSF